jgi:hypothetical protein
MNMIGRAKKKSNFVTDTKWCANREGVDIIAGSLMIEVKDIAAGTSSADCAVQCVQQALPSLTYI